MHVVPFSGLEPYHKENIDPPPSTLHPPTLILMTVTKVMNRQLNPCLFAMTMRKRPNPKTRILQQVSETKAMKAHSSPGLFAMKMGRKPDIVNLHLEVNSCLRNSTEFFPQAFRLFDESSAEKKHGKTLNPKP